MRYIISSLMLLALALAVPSFASETALPAPGGEDQAAAMQNYIGTKAFEQNLYGEAERHFRQAVMIDPSFAEAHYNLGLVLHEQGNHAEAGKHFKEARMLAKGNKDILDSKVLLHDVTMRAEGTNDNP